MSSCLSRDAETEIQIDSLQQIDRATTNCAVRITHSYGLIFNLRVRTSVPYLRHEYVHTIEKYVRDRGCLSG